MSLTERRLPRILSALGALALAGLLVTACGTPAVPASTTSPPSLTPPAPTPDATVPEDEIANGAPDGAQAAVTVARDQEVRLTDPSQNSVHCDGGGEVYVQFAGTVTITGACQEVDITAGGATVALEMSEDVDIESSGNQLNADEIGDLDIDGDNNTVTVGTVREIDIDGSGNAVTYSGGAPDVEVSGSGNVVAPG